MTETISEKLIQTTKTEYVTDLASSVEKSCIKVLTNSPEFCSDWKAITKKEF